MLMIFTNISRQLDNIAVAFSRHYDFVDTQWNTKILVHTLFSLTHENGPYSQLF